MTDRRIGRKAIEQPCGVNENNTWTQDERTKERLDKLGLDIDSIVDFFYCVGQCVGLKANGQYHDMCNLGLATEL